MILKKNWSMHFTRDCSPLSVYLAQSIAFLTVSHIFFIFISCTLEKKSQSLLFDLGSSLLRHKCSYPLIYWFNLLSRLLFKIFIKSSVLYNVSIFLFNTVCKFLIIIIILFSCVILFYWTSLKLLYFLFRLQWCTWSGTKFVGIQGVGKVWQREEVTSRQRGFLSEEGSWLKGWN